MLLIKRFKYNLNERYGKEGLNDKNKVNAYSNFNHYALIRLCSGAKVQTEFNSGNIKNQSYSMQQGRPGRNLLYKIALLGNNLSGRMLQRDEQMLCR